MSRGTNWSLPVNCLVETTFSKKTITWLSLTSGDSSSRFGGLFHGVFQMVPWGRVKCRKKKFGGRRILDGTRGETLIWGKKFLKGGSQLWMTPWSHSFVKSFPVAVWPLNKPTLLESFISKGWRMPVRSNVTLNQNQTLSFKACKQLDHAAKNNTVTILRGIKFDSLRQTLFRLRKIDL